MTFSLPLPLHNLKNNCNIIPRFKSTTKTNDERNASNEKKAFQKSSKINNSKLYLTCDLVSSTGLIMRIGHRKEIRKLTFRALALRWSESRNCAFVCGVSFRISLRWPIRIINPVGGLYKPHTTHNSSIRSDEGLTLEASAFEFLNGGQFALSTQLMKPNYLVILPTDAAPQFR